MTFADLSLSPRLLAALDGMGYRQPTPVQRGAIPPALAGEDVLALAATGTGKTAAFVLPMLQRLMDGPRGAVRALVVAPTRELAEQTHDHVRRLGSMSRLRSTTIYGGVGVVAQALRLRAGVEVVVGCPGRLLDHIRRGNLDLSSLEVLVLDEGDSLFDLGFLADVRMLLGMVPTTCQRMLFSATMPDAVRVLAAEALRQPVTVQVDAVQPASTVHHALYPVPAHLRTPLLKTFLRSGPEGSVVVFVRTRHGARRLWQQLDNVGFSVTCLQGKLSQRRRLAALEGFRDGRYDVLVATDVAARGLDISQVTHVVNYDVPSTADAYIHRVGRTGRAARNGTAMTFVTPADEAQVRNIERALGTVIPRERLADFDYGAPVRGPEGARPAMPPRQPRLPAGKRPAAPQEAQEQPRRGRPRPPRHAVPPAAHPPTIPSRLPRQTPAGAEQVDFVRSSRMRGQGGDSDE